MNGFNRQILHKKYEGIKNQGKGHKYTIFHSSAFCQPREQIADRESRQKDKEEKEVCEKWGINDGTLEAWEKKVFTCRLPDKNQQILISTHWGISLDVCTWDEDEGIGLEERGDWDGVLAWMPVPEPYIPEEETE